jgi:phospholipid/cholesterol/gamma-HCH transport system substrate-binding protein
MTAPKPTGVPTRSRVPSSAYKMAVFAAVTVVLLGMVATLIGNISFAPTRTYYAHFSDATGVLKGDRVRLSGVEVGKVQGVRLADGEDGRKEAVVEFEVRTEVPVLDSAHLELRFENIVGQRYLAIEETPGNGQQMPEGGVFPSTQTSPALNLTELFNGFQPLLRALDPEQTNKLSYEIVRAFQGEAVGIANLLRDTASLTQTLADKDEVIGSVVTNLTQVLTTVDLKDRELTALIVEFRDLMVGLSSDRNTISFELPRLHELMTQTTGLIRDIRPPFARTVRGLARVARQLNIDREILQDSLREIPAKLRMIARTGSYGSWFNFYVCGVEVRIKVLNDTIYLGTPGIAANEKDSVCGGADAVPPADGDGGSR